MGKPVLFFWQCLIDHVIKVLVVREDDMAADIVELARLSALIFLTMGRRAVLKARELLTKPSGVTSVDARPPGVPFESMTIHDGPS